MTRLIDADKVYKIFDKFSGQSIVAYELREEVKKIPTVEARPQGKWINPTKNTDFCNRDLFSDCSICGHTQMDETNFCPNCGANMRGGAEE